MQSEQGMSTWNGYKLMSRQVADAAIHCDRTFPPNIHGTVQENPQEWGRVFHDMGGRSRGTGVIDLVPGPLNIGTDGSVEVPRDISASTATVAAHQHPYTGEHLHNEPSMNDHLIARAFPDVEHIVQTPAAHRHGPNPYIIYTGALPPRFYTLVENPFDLPVPPPSPDGNQVPPFHPYPSTR